MHDTSESPTTSCSRHMTLTAVILLAFTICLLAAPVMANPPSAITISYDPGAAKILVTITHPVDDPATHYLKTVRVKLNDRVISDPEYKNQTSRDGFTSTYDVNANPGDTVRITAICVQGGTLEQTYIVRRAVTRVVTTAAPAAPAGADATRSSAPDSSPTAKAAAGLLPLLGAAAVVLMIGRK